MSEPHDPLREKRALAMTTAVLGVLALFTLRAFVAPMLVGAFFAALTYPWARKLAKRAGTRRRVAAFATAVLVVALILPIAVLAVPVAALITEALEALTQGRPGEIVRNVTRLAISPATPGASAVAGATAWSRLWELTRQFGPGAATLATKILSSLSSAIVQIFVLVASAYVCTAQGAIILDVARRGSPLKSEHFDRLCREALSVARALLVGGVLTALAQAFVAAIIYTLVGVPNPILFAALTGIASVVPAVGTALVWLPLVALLFGEGRVQAAVILAVCGVAIISTVDNLLRPFLARIGAENVHPIVLFVGVMGGLVTFGPWGLVLGPLVLALFLAAYRMRAGEPEREKRSSIPP